MKPKNTGRRDYKVKGDKDMLGLNAARMLLLGALLACLGVAQANERELSAKVGSAKSEAQTGKLGLESAEKNWLKVLVDNPENTVVNDCDIGLLSSTYLNQGLPGSPLQPSALGFSIAVDADECAEFIASDSLEGRCDEYAVEMSTNLELNIPLDGYVAPDGSCGCTCGEGDVIVEPPVDDDTRPKGPPVTGIYSSCTEDLLAALQAPVVLQPGNQLGQNPFYEYASWVTTDGIVVFDIDDPSTLDLEGRCSVMSQVIGMDLTGITFEVDGTTYAGCQCDGCIAHEHTHFRKLNETGQLGSGQYRSNVGFGTTEGGCQLNYDGGVSETWLCPDFLLELPDGLDANSYNAASSSVTSFPHAATGESVVSLGTWNFKSKNYCPDPIDPAEMGYSPCRLELLDSEFVAASEPLPAVVENLLVDYYQVSPPGNWHAYDTPYEQADLYGDRQIPSADQYEPLTTCRMEAEDGWMKPTPNNNGSGNYYSAWNNDGYVDEVDFIPPMNGSQAICIQHYDNTDCDNSAPGCGTWVGTYQLQCQ